MLRRTPRLAQALVASSLAACAPAPASLAWRIELEDPTQLSRAAVVDARILRGGCGGDEVFGVSLRPGDGMSLVPPVLGPGVWGFAAAAHDASCARFAQSCEEVTLPGTTLVENVLEAVSPTQVCTGARCDGGSCRAADEDGDGVGACVDGAVTGDCDCDDADADVRPGAEDPCGDAVDQDCDGADDDCDADCDGFPEGDPTRVDGRDCDDGSIDVHPNGSPRDLWSLADGDRLARGCEAMPTPAPVSDACVMGSGGTPEGDGIDQDCNGFVDDGVGCTDPDDRDRDGAAACSGAMLAGCDPDDCDPGVGPGRTERCGNAFDEDGDGVAAPCDPDDADRDGQRASAASGTDCDDTDPRAYLGAPDDCRTSEAESCGAPIACSDGGGDEDGDGFVARPPSGPGDCNDRDPAVRPFAPEDPCDGDDDDCDGVVDEVVRAPDATPGAPDGCVRAGGSAVALDYHESRASSEHCGGCGVATEANEDCCAGAPTAIDQPSSCGACGFECGAHTACPRTGADASGDVHACACASDGSGDWADCDGSLGSSGSNGCEVDLDTDALHCGTCGRRCGANETCQAGECRCAGSFLDCDATDSNGCEIDGSDDVAHCGGCGRRCAPANARGACTASACRIETCTSGFADCNGGAGDGCEARLDTLTSCGRCGETCAGVANAARICAASMRCDYSACDPGFGDCDGNRSNGCERSLTTVTSCGACGNACGAGESCNASGDCACGARTAASGPACTAGQTCVSGTCVAT